MSKKAKVIIIVVASVVVLLAAGAGGAYYYFMNRINYETADDIVMAPTDIVSGSSIVEVPKLENDSNIVNILLIGEEALAEGKDSNRRGRSDCNIVLTINRKEKTAKLISFLRDTYVQVPGYRDNKLNASYEMGGGPLVQDVLQVNFNVVTDGYIRVKFSDFKKVIDALDGVDIKLTASEATYLNHTNYISKKKFRNVKEGVNHLNGNQALGYCRIRRGKNYEAVLTEDGQANDWGRTTRQRNVLKAIFEEYKDKSLTELVSIANEIMPLATTNMDHDQLLALLGVVVDLDIDKLDTLTIPLATEYTPYNEGARVSAALQVNFETMKQKIDNFMKNKEAEASASPSASPN